MAFLMAFLEGIVTFISPCMLPMIPVYISYFAGNKTGGKKTNALTNALGFVLGFTIMFVILGAFAGSIGSALRQHAATVHLVTGLVIILFGLNYIGILKIGFLNATKKFDANTKNLNFISSLFFGFVFSVGWTPCVGAFLGSALMMAASSPNRMDGILMLLCYSVGLGIPFVLSALLIDRLKAAFDFIKRNYKVINIVSGIALIVLGILMMMGLLVPVLG